MLEPLPSRPPMKSFAAMKFRFAEAAGKAESQKQTARSGGACILCSSALICCCLNDSTEGIKARVQFPDEAHTLPG